MNNWLKLIFKALKFGKVKRKSYITCAPNWDCPLPKFKVLWIRYVSCCQYSNLVVFCPGPQWSSAWVKLVCRCGDDALEWIELTPALRAIAIWPIVKGISRSDYISLLSDTSGDWNSLINCLIFFWSSLSLITWLSQALDFQIALASVQIQTFCSCWSRSCEMSSVDRLITIGSPFNQHLCWFLLWRDVEHRHPLWLKVSLE